MKNENNLTLEQKWEQATLANNFIFYKVMHNHPERARFYQSVLDVDDLNEGGSYKDLKTSYIIFICIPDIFNKGLAKYTFENTCIEKTGLKLNDRSYKLFFIAENYDKIFNEEQKSFLKLVVSNDSTGDFSDKLSRLVEDAKHNTQWRKQFMDLEIEKIYSFRAGKAEGLVEGAQEKAVETAEIMLSDNLPLDKVAFYSGLSLEQVKELAAKILQKTI
ncbi:MAG: Rpn family recombination-promoting nuclease/putative transposase [Treponema sp.]|nr:Rpn family recombination-promoting nuclease/putative transposase [Treponema sp.]